MNNKIAKFLFPTLAGTVFGFSTILASFGTAFASESIIIESPVDKAISNVVLYLQDSSGNFLKVKVDNFSALQETQTYDPTNVLQNYPNYTLVAYTVKAGNNKSNMGSGEGKLEIIPGSGVEENQLPTYNTTDANTYQYKDVYSSSPNTSNTNNNNSSTTTSSVDNSVNTVNSTTTDNTQSNPVANQSSFFSSNNGNTTQPVSVPEPGTVTAIIVFGLGSFFTKKKLTSSAK